MYKNHSRHLHCREQVYSKNIIIFAIFMTRKLYTRGPYKKRIKNKAPPGRERPGRFPMYRPVRKRIRLQGVHHFSRIVDGQTLSGYNVAISGGGSFTYGAQFPQITLGGAGVTYASIAFSHKLTDCFNYAEFTALFDQYKINYIKFKIEYLTPNISPAVAGSAIATGGTGTMYYFNDHDDNTAIPATLAGYRSVIERMGVKQVNLANLTCFTRNYQPRIAQAAYGSGVFSSYSNVAPPWIDSVSSTVEHYGTKLFFEITNPDAQPRILSFKILFTYYMSFKDVL